LNSQRFHRISHLIASPFALKQTQKILPITSLMAIVEICICLKLSGGGGVVALFFARKAS
jgi:hypothetical protein